MRESYKRFVKTWICFAKWIHLWKDSFPGFISYYGVQNIRFVDWICRLFLTGFGLFHESNESSWILSTIDLRIHTNLVLPDSRIPTLFKRFVSWIGFVLRCSKDSFCGFVSYYVVQKIRFVDSFRDKIFERFVSWIRFVRKKSQKGLFCITSEGFVYESRILTSDYLTHYH
jgi:hypothetical protein